jgi:hypothetical protein
MKYARKKDINLQSPISVVTAISTYLHTTYYYPFGGKPPKAREPLLCTDQLTAEELNYSCDRAQQHQCSTNNLLEV